MPPALLVERFDIRESLEDKRLIALEDFASVLDLPDAGEIQRHHRARRQGRPAALNRAGRGLILIIRRALFAWLIADGDMHLKNMALLKIAEPGDAQFRSVRAGAALRRGDDARLSRGSSTTAWPSSSTARTTICGGRFPGARQHGRRQGCRRRRRIDETLARMKEANGRIALPDLPDHRAEAASIVEKMIAIIRGQLDSFS